MNIPEFKVANAEIMMKEVVSVTPAALQHF